MVVLHDMQVTLLPLPDSITISSFRSDQISESVAVLCIWIVQNTFIILGVFTRLFPSPVRDSISLKFRKCLTMPEP